MSKPRKRKAGIQEMGQKKKKGKGNQLRSKPEEYSTNAGGCRAPGGHLPEKMKLTRSTDVSAWDREINF